MRGSALSVDRKSGLDWMDRQGEKGALFIDTYKGAPTAMKRFSVWNPFFLHSKPCIPVPGQFLYSRSVEAIWQGLKIVEGSVDFDMFNRVPEKRPSEDFRISADDFKYWDTKFLFNESVIGIVAARFLIYLPTYLFVIRNLTSSTLLREVGEVLDSGKNVIFFDWDSNMDIANDRESFSHSSILAAWFSGTLSDIFVRAKCYLSPQMMKSFEERIHSILA